MDRREMMVASARKVTAMGGKQLRKPLAEMSIPEAMDVFGIVEEEAKKFVLLQIQRVVKDPSIAMEAMAYLVTLVGKKVVFKFAYAMVAYMNSRWVGGPFRRRLVQKALWSSINALRTKQQ